MIGNLNIPPPIDGELAAGKKRKATPKKKVKAGDPEPVETVTTTTKDTTNSENVLTSEAGKKKTRKPKTSSTNTRKMKSGDPSASISENNLNILDSSQHKFYIVGRPTVEGQAPIIRPL